jgi:uncharacterized protein
MKSDQNIIIQNTITFVKVSLTDSEGGHDWWHTYRVLQVSRAISKEENACLFICELGALLHDIADPKFHDGDEINGSLITRKFLEDQDLDNATISRVIEIIDNVSYKGGQGNHIAKSLELKVVQDADRLDALGAIGIARAFNYGGYKNRKLYDPDIPPKKYSSAGGYRKSDAPTINHFYEKLLLLKDLMNTETGRKMAEKRHRFLKEFLKRFKEEWEGIS